MGGIGNACVWISGIRTSTETVATCAITDRTTVNGFRVLLRFLDSNNEPSSMFDLLLQISPGRTKLAGS